ncbi:MAG: holo-ACP synthase [Acidobacteriota bacterium]
MSHHRVLAVGLDVVEVDRIAAVHRRRPEAFVRRLCRPGECQDRRGPALDQHLSGLFAAKEAVLKALGTGWAEGLAFRQIEVVRRPGGAPAVRLHAAAADRARSLGVARIHLSITHERRHAAAVAVLEGVAPPTDTAHDPLSPYAADPPALHRDA